MAKGFRKGEDGDTIHGGFITPSNGTLQPRVVPKDMSDPAGGFTPGAGKGRKTKLAAFGLNPTIIREGDPQYAAALYQANKYRKTRMKELARF